MEYPIRIDDISLSIDYYDEVIKLVKESKEYLISQSWCKSVSDGWLFTNLGKVLCIFLYRIDNLQSPEDDLLWVLVGDFPPMYLDTLNVSDTQDVVEVYVDLVNDWIKHVELGESMDDCFPLKSDHSSESIQSLKKRLNLLKNSIAQNIDKIHFSTKNA
jgi:hypothetical protein